MKWSLFVALGDLIKLEASIIFPQVLSRETFTSISSPLTHVFNLLLSSGVVPETKDCACRNIV